MKPNPSTPTAPVTLNPLDAFAIQTVLRSSCEAQVCSSVVQTIPIDVVDFLVWASVKNKTVEVDRSSLYSRSGINFLARVVQIPGVFVQQVGILGGDLQSHTPHYGTGRSWQSSMYFETVE